MNWLETIKIPKGYLEIIVSDHKTGEIVEKRGGPNQVQDWARHALAYLMAGRTFCSWGNHGEQITDVGTTYQIAHYKDGRDGSTPTDIITSSPWVQSSTTDYTGLIQLRTLTDGDQIGDSVTNGTSLYPFFPTKMRFGTGGLDSDQNPLTNIPTSQTTLNAVESTYPFILVDRQRGSDAHINLSESGSIQASNKVTFSCKLPGGYSSYPYNDKVISEAGLFCDASLAVDSDVNMRTGILLAYRTFYGITKNESIDVTFNWSFVF